MLNTAIRRIGYERGSQAALTKERDNIIKLTHELIEGMDYAPEMLTFDELEINTLFLDEAHNYKNVPIRTKMRNLRGINTKGSLKCYEMLQKVRSVQVSDKGHGVVFATGSPLCNSLADTYTMQMYLQYEDMERNRLEGFDNWVKTFAKPEKVAEVDVDAQHYRYVTRFSKFFNLPELSRMFSDVAVFHAMETEDGLLETEGYTDCVIEKNDDLTAYMLFLASRTDTIREGGVSPKEDNMLKVSTDGRKAALELRLVKKNSRRRLLKLRNVQKM
jgi:DNA methylase